MRPQCRTTRTGGRRFAVVAASIAGVLALASPAAGQQSCLDRAPEYASMGPPGTGAANDPLFSEQWGLDQINAPEAWALGARGAGAVIAILDTGIDQHHPDLAGQWLPGADLVDENDCDGVQDEAGHGTHVAGIAVAATGNGIGVAGVAPDARALPVRLGQATIERDAAAAGIDYAVAQGADVINMSWRSEWPDEQSDELLGFNIAAALARAWESGAVLVAGAGNGAGPVCDYPGSAPHVVCVAGTDRRMNPMAYSNLAYDTDAEDADGSTPVRAPAGLVEGYGADCGDGRGRPAEGVWSTMLPVSNGYGNCEPRGYDTLTGTSMSTPHVAAVAALLVARGLTNAAVVDCLRRTSLNPRTGDRGTFDPVFGYGVVDAEAAVRTCAPAALAPPPGTPPTAAPAPGSRPRTPFVFIPARTLRLRAARVRVPVGCRDAERCAGVLTLRARGRSLGRSRYAIAGERTRLVPVRLSRRAARSIPRRRALRVTATARPGDGAPPATATLDIRR